MLHDDDPVKRLALADRDDPARRRQEVDERRDVGTALRDMRQIFTPGNSPSFAIELAPTGASIALRAVGDVNDVEILKRAQRGTPSVGKRTAIRRPHVLSIASGDAPLASRRQA